MFYVLLFIIYIISKNPHIEVGCSIGQIVRTFKQFQQNIPAKEFTKCPAMFYNLYNPLLILHDINLNSFVKVSLLRVSHETWTK